jgi:hypothetical protein
LYWNLYLVAYSIFTKNIRQSPVNICPFFLYRGAVTATAHQEEQDETKNDASLLTI